MAENGEVNLPNQIQSLFEVKQKFLREIPHPTIIKKNAERLAKQAQIELAFELSSVENNVTLEVFLEDYQSLLMPLKLRIANGQEKSEVARVLQELFHLQMNLIRQLGKYDGTTDVHLTEEIKMSTAFDAYGLLKFLRENEIQESEINNYLCAAFKSQSEQEMSILTKSVLRAKKIIDYEQI